MTNTTHAIERMYFFEVARLLREPHGPIYFLVHGPGIFQDKLQTRLWSDWGTAPVGKTLEYGHSY